MTIRSVFLAHSPDVLPEWIIERSWAYFFLLAGAAHIIYHFTKSYLQYRADIDFGRRHHCQPPPELPTRWPLGIDRIKELWDSNSEGHLLAFLCSVAKDYEPHNNLSQYLLVGPRAFHVLHPKNVESILSTNFNGKSPYNHPQLTEITLMNIFFVDYNFGVRRDVFAPLLGNGIFAQEGLAWKHSRELLRKQFVLTQYQNLDRFREHVDNLISCLPDDKVIDIQPLFFNLTLDTTSALLLGKSVYSLRASIDQDAENKLFSESFNMAQEGLAKRFRIAPWHFFYNPPAFRQACSNAHRFIERYIEENDAKTEQDPLDGKSEGFIHRVKEESASKEDLRDQLLNVLLAGRDTTACCLSWTFRLLVRHSLVMDRLRKEISSIMGHSETPTRELIRRMPYLSGVIKESLRIYPPVPLNNRQATRTTMLPTGGGPNGDSPILVRKGEMVVYSQYVNSRMKSIYGEDADQFRPERWEDKELAGIGWAYFPFSGGPRQCLGEDFALMLVSYTVIKLIQASSRIVLPEGENVEPVGMEKQRLTLVLSSAEGCRVRFQRL